ncbi:TetR family transcriptional regulator C-terminal domain-containing protein [Eudoraea sp.]|uniref:TetR family transcriptional regulator C-terminal domain-containing protein n=2 Tax=Eudoraea sp. TaxID=1979955 RepID=UPI003C734114
MATKASSKKITKDLIISSFMNIVLEEEEVPKSIYRFCKTTKISEEDFYEHFGSIQGIQEGIWNAFYDNTQQLAEKNKEYEQFSSKDKMLTFFFTFFELLKLNRSYVLFVFEDNNNSLKNLRQLKGLRHKVKDFATELIEDDNAEKHSKITKNNPMVFSEGAWLQLLFLLKFWKEDNSAGFEKTDIAIEKSVKTIFDVFDNTPLDSILDFGKFLFKENFR